MKCTTFKQAVDKLYIDKGWIIQNMLAPYKDEFEIVDVQSIYIIDHLSVAQVIDISNMF